MRTPLFTVPRLRGLGWLVHVHPDSTLGSADESLWPAGADVGTLERLLGRWSGMLRAFTMAGYRPVDLFVEALSGTAAGQLVVDLTTFGAAVVDPRPDGLGDARSSGVPLVVGLTIDPLWVFGEPAGAPLALPLPVEELEAVAGVFAPVSDTERGWLGVALEHEDLWDARERLDEVALAVAELLAPIVAASWFEEPSALGPPCGLGWMFDSSGWWFPPHVPERIEPDARLIRDPLAAVVDAIGVGLLDRDEFVAGQTVRLHDPRMFGEDGSFGRLTREWASQPPDAAIDAYLRRVVGLSTPNVDLPIHLAEHLDRRLTWTDAVLALAEHGALAVGHRLLPGHPSTALALGEVGVTIPEWTSPCLTGQWDAVASTDTIILNQAGTALNGFWQRRVGSRLVRYELGGSMVNGDRIGGPLEFEVEVRQIPDATDPPDDGESPDDEIVNPLVDDDAIVYVSEVAGQSPQLRFVLTQREVTTERVFEAAATGGGRAHHTEWTLAHLPEPVRARVLALRDAPLHAGERPAIEHLVILALEYVERFLTENPSNPALTSMMVDFTNEMRDKLGSFRDNEALMRTVQFHVHSILVSLRPEGGDSHVGVLRGMFELTHRTTLELQKAYGMQVLQQTEGADFRYRWRLSGIDMLGGGAGVGIATGTGVFELQQVDESGSPVGPVISRTIDLVSVDFGGVMGPMFGPDDIEEWQYLNPTFRDVTHHLDGATFSLVGLNAGWLVVDSSSSVEVLLQPTDGLAPVEGRIDADLLSSWLLEPIDDPAAMLEQTDNSKELVETAVDLLETVAKEGLEAALREGKKLLVPSASFVTTDGYIRTADGTPTAPEQPPIEADAYATGDGDEWARFETERYEVTGAFRDRIRQCLLSNLALFTNLGELLVEGHASQVGPDDYNIRLSRDRAASVLTVIYDILGPQLAVPIGDIRILGHGSSKSTGTPESDAAYDRRVDVSIAGQIRLRS